MRLEYLRRRWSLRGQLHLALLVAVPSGSLAVNTRHQHPDHSPLHPQAQAPPGKAKLPGFDAETAGRVAKQTQRPRSKLSGTIAGLSCALRRLAEQIRFRTSAFLR